MLEGKSLVFKVVTIVCLILMLACVVFQIASISRLSNECFVICDLIAILALVCSAIYMIKGSSKSQAYLYFCFLGFYACASFFRILACIVEGFGIWYIIAHLVVFGITLIVALKRDMGRVKSLLFCGGDVAVELVLLLIFLSKGFEQEYVSGQIAFLLMGTVLGFCTVAKYIDKKSRGAY